MQNYIYIHVFEFEIFGTKYVRIHKQPLLIRASFFLFLPNKKLTAYIYLKLMQNASGRSTPLINQIRRLRIYPFASTW